ncbi:MAG TPA: alpha/beta hydrolase-fold protein [Opitutaceae bacterium]
MKPTITKAKPAFVSHSKETGTDYTIYIDSPREAPGQWDAVLLMDGDYFFDAAVEAARSLRKEGRIPHTAIIGVGYGVGFGMPGNFRGRDYTPTASPEEPTSGGADRFLAYLSDTLWPELARRHPLRESGRAIAGHSLGSLLVLHALFQPKPFFSRALASAPSIWWDNRSLLGLISSLRTRQKELVGRLYLGVGADDSPSMLGDLDLLEKQLRDRPFEGLKVVSERFPGRDHYDAVAVSVRAGLATLLD